MPATHSLDDEDSLHHSLIRLLDRAASGDADAFADVYERTSRHVLGRVLRVLRDPEQSEEVAQEVFLDVWRHCGRFDPGVGAPMSWILLKARSAAIDRVRASEASRRRDNDHYVADHRPPRDTTADQAHRRIEDADVRAHLMRLSPTLRQPLELFYFAGLTHQEIADHLGAPLGTTKSRLRTGLQRLREQMSGPTPI